MFDPKTFMNKYTGEPGFVTAPDDTMTNWPTLADMHALATATKPALSTTVGVPPPLEAEAANTTELAPFTAFSMADLHDSIPSRSLPSRYSPCLVHALQDIPACTQGLHAFITRPSIGPYYNRHGAALFGSEGGSAGGTLAQRPSSPPCRIRGEWILYHAPPARVQAMHDSSSSCWPPPASSSTTVGAALDSRLQGIFARVENANPSAISVSRKEQQEE